MPRIGLPKQEWTCTSPECDKTFMKHAGQIVNVDRPYCSSRCAQRHLSLLKLPMADRLEAAQRYERGEHTGVLAEAYGVSSATMGRALKELGVHLDRRRSGAASWVARTGVPADEGDLNTGFRWCCDCRERKSMNEYYWRKIRNGVARTRQRRCRTCHYRVTRARGDLRANRRKYLYGMTQAEYERIWARQGGACAICRKPAKDDDGRGLVVDHNHLTGSVRGLLCQQCNYGLGHFRDNGDYLHAAAWYLELDGHDPGWFPVRITDQLGQAYLATVRA